MSTYTPNLNLAKPAEGDTDWAGEVNGNSDTLDTAVGAEHTASGKHRLASGTGGFPGSPLEGDLFIRIDENAIYRYFPAGGGWVKIGDGDAISSGDSAGGDLSGTYPNPTVAKIQGRAVASTAPASDQVLKWSTGSNAWVPGEAVLDGDSAGGDLSGTYPNPTVAKVQGKGVDASPSTSDLLQYNGTSWEAKGATSGDSLADLYVGALTIVDSKHLKWNTDGGGDIGASGANRPGTIYALTEVKVGSSCSLKTDRLALNPQGSAPGSLAGGNLWCQYGISEANIWFRDGTAGATKRLLKDGESTGGDLSGTYPTTLTVAKIQGRSVASTAPTSNQVLKWNSGSSQWEPGTAMLSGDSAGGDLSGTYPNPTVAKIQGYSMTSGLPTKGDVWQFDGTNWIHARNNYRVLAIGSASISSGSWVAVASYTPVANEFSANTIIKMIFEVYNPSNPGVDTEMNYNGGSVKIYGSTDSHNFYEYHGWEEPNRNSYVQYCVHAYQGINLGDYSTGTASFMATTGIWYARARIYSGSGTAYVRAYIIAIHKE